MMERENTGPETVRPKADRGWPPLPDNHESASAEVKVRELEVENQRLQLLVAELLIKNQQLRKVERDPKTSQ